MHEMTLHNTDIVVGCRMKIDTLHSPPMHPGYPQELAQGHSEEPLRYPVVQ